jgi:hypothetical protein
LRDDVTTLDVSAPGQRRGRLRAALAPPARRRLARRAAHGLDALRPRGGHAAARSAPLSYEEIDALIAPPRYPVQRPPEQ